MKKSQRKKLVKRLDKVFSLFIRKRDGHCVICGKTERLTAGHLITRAKYSVRWDERNVFCQCAGCNLTHEHNSHIFTDWYIRKFGLNAYQNLILESNQTKKFSDLDLELMINKYQAAFLDEGIII